MLQIYAKIANLRNNFELQGSDYLGRSHKWQLYRQSKTSLIDHCIVSYTDLLFEESLDR